MSETVETPATPEEMQKELDRLRQSNQDKYTALVRGGDALDPAAILALRFETFLDTFIHGDDRLAFELSFEARVNESFNEALKQQRQKQIMAGTQNVNPAGLVIPGK